MLPRWCGSRGASDLSCSRWSMGIFPAPGRSHLPPQPMHLVPGMKSHHAQEGPTAFLPSHPARVPTLFRWRSLGLAGLQLAFYREHRGRRPQLTSSPGKVGASSCRLGTGARTLRGSQRRSDRGMPTVIAWLLHPTLSPERKKMLLSLVLLSS